MGSGPTMRLVLVLSATAASVKLTDGQVQDMIVTYPICTTSMTNFFLDNLSVASSGCMDTIAYVWRAEADPTDAEREELCACTVTTFVVPKCYWTKERINVSTREHFGFTYNCTNFSGKATPPVTEMDAAAAETAAPLVTSTEPDPDSTEPSPSPTAAPANCTMQQVTAFTSALNKASSDCMSGTSYLWDGHTNPTKTQYDEICQCTPVSKFDIPECSVQKGPDSITLAVHYFWVTTTQCPVMATASVTATTSSVGLVAGIAGGVLVVVLIVGFVCCKRKRQQEQHSPPTDGAVLRSPASYQPMHETPRIPKATTDARPSGASTATHTASSTLNGTASHGTTTSVGLAETGAWDDPVIVAVRVPHDMIFFASLLSRGSFGEVYRGIYKGETVAIKQLLPDRRRDLGQIDDFLCEVKLVSSLEHERIVRFIGVAWNSLSDACMVVEFMENGDLRAMLGRWAAGPEQRRHGFDADKVKIALHIAHALVYLHSLRPVVVHRDLKSKNILLNASLDAKLTDFGISRERADATMTAGVGSALWMAPEVMMGDRYGEKADIFSFGVVLSELDTHQLPYAHAKVTGSGQKLPEAAILQQVMLGRLSVGFTNRANPALVQLGRECVSLDPKARPTTAQVLYRVQQVMRQ